MKTIILSIPVLAFLLFNAVAQQPDYSQLRNEAEAQYAQGSYARANELYAKVDKSKLSASELRWVEFRLADTLWRAQAGTQTPDTTRYEQAKKQLEELIRVIDKETDRDLVWAEAHESLGDLFWTRRRLMNWGIGLAALSCRPRLVGRSTRHQPRPRSLSQNSFQSRTAAWYQGLLLLHLPRQLHPARHS